MTYQNTIKIYYKGECDGRKDNIIERAMRYMGYTLVGSGYDFETKERDLEFGISDAIIFLLLKLNK